MDFSSYFPIWNKLSASEKEQLSLSTVFRKIKGGTIIYHGSADCQGLFLIHSGQLRAYILSDTGREITLYRLFEQDICLFSASCIINSLQFEITVEAEKDSKLWVIPSSIYKRIMENSAPLANYTNEIMASRFSDVMWLMEQIMWKSMDKRLASFLLEETRLEQSSLLQITHERIANHMGTAREVITRILRYFQNERLVKLARGTIQVLDSKKLQLISEE